MVSVFVSALYYFRINLADIFDLVIIIRCALGRSMFLIQQRRKCLLMRPKKPKLLFHFPFISSVCVQCGPHQGEILSQDFH